MHNLPIYTRVVVTGATKICRRPTCSCPYLWNDKKKQLLSSSINIEIETFFISLLLDFFV